jgi:hypothetical protein
MRVIISPGDVAPAEIAHPALPQSKPVSAAAARAAEAVDAAGLQNYSARSAGMESPTASVRAQMTLTRSSLPSRLSGMNASKISAI